MKKEEIHFDVVRILLGQTPPVFLVEVLLRGIVIFIVLMVAIRLMGKRMASQQSYSEMIVVLILGAAVAVPAQDPSRGIVQGIMILAIVITLQKGISFWAYKRKNIKYLTQGDVDLLISDGILDSKVLIKIGLTRDRLLGELRDMKVIHLGQVERLYLETSGDFSLYLFKEPRPGLSILPDFDEEIRNEQEKADGQFACCTCGNIKQYMPGTPCNVCGSKKWTEAVRENYTPSEAPELPFSMEK